MITNHLKIIISLFGKIYSITVNDELHLITNYNEQKVL